MKKLLTLIILLVSKQLYSQDTLYFLGGNKEIAKVDQVNPKEVHYHLWNLPNGPEIIVLRGKLEKIVFSNGMPMKFNSAEDKALQKKVLKNQVMTDFKRNTVGINLAELFLFRIGGSYERILGKKGWFSIRVPFSVSLKDKKATFREEVSYYPYYADYAYEYDNGYEMGGRNYSMYIPRLGNSSNFSPASMVYELSSKDIYLNYGNSFYTGLGGRCYFGGQKRKNFYLGLEFQGGMFTYSLQNLLSTSYDSNGDLISVSWENTQGKVGSMFGYILEIGGRINSMQNRLSLSIGAGFGQRFLFNVPTQSGNRNNGFPFLFNNLTFQPHLQLGYSFGKSKQAK